MQIDVFVSILALDSYNRGYGANVNGLTESGKLGTAIIRRFSPNQQSGWQSAGFYAIAYDWNGETVISYRGTNFDTTTTSQTILDSPLVRDAFNGWSVGAGFNEASQAGLAIRFYEDVTGRSVFERIGGGPTRLTGHSLGGGLAGFVGALAYRPAIGFDHMPYGLAAIGEAFSEALNLTLRQFSIANASLPTVLESIATGVFTSLIFGDSTLPQLTVEAFLQALRDNWDQVKPNTEALSGFFADGEVLQYVRSGQVQFAAGSVLGGILSLVGFPGLGAALQTYGISLGISTAQLEALVEKTPVDLYGTDLSSGGVIGPIDQAVGAHSMALLTTLMFGQKQWESEGGGSTWTQSIRYILPHLTGDDDLAGRAFDLALGVTGAASAGAQLATIVAYSAINEGERPFGDTGIRALFNDADDLGASLSALPMAVNADVKDQIGRIITEFAGLLATTKTLATQNSTATLGILSRTGDAQGPTALNINLRDSTWYDVKSGYESIVSEELVNSLVIGNGDAANAFSQLKGWYSINHGASGSGDLVKDFDLISLSLRSGLLFRNDDSSGVTVTVGSDGADNFEFLGNADFVIAGKTADRIGGGAGNDILLGGEGADTLAGGSGNDWISGGEGNDTIWGDDLDGDGQVGSDTVFYGADIGSTHLSYNGRLPNAPLTVATNLQGKDTLYGIEEVILTGGTVSFSLTNHIAESTYLTVRAGPTTGTNLQLIDAAKLTGGARFRFNIANGGGSSIYDKSTNGQINLYGFNTQIVGTEFDDDIIDGSTASKILSGGQGNDTLQVNSGNSALFGGQGNDTLTGGTGNDILIAGEGADSVSGGNGADLIIADMQGRSANVSGGSPVSTSVSGGAGADYISVGVTGYGLNRPETIRVSGGSGNDYVLLGAQDTRSIVKPLASGGTSISNAMTYAFSLGSRVQIGPGIFATLPGDGQDTVTLENADLVRNGAIGFDIRNVDSTKIKFTFQIRTSTVQTIVGEYDGVRDGYLATMTGDLMITFPGSTDSLIIKNTSAFCHGWDPSSVLNADLRSGWVDRFGFSGLNIQANGYTGVPLYLLLNTASTPFTQSVPSAALLDRFTFGGVGDGVALADFYTQSGLPAPLASPSASPLRAAPMLAAASAPTTPTADTFGTSEDDAFNYERGNRTIDGGDGYDVLQLYGDITDFQIGESDGILSISDRWGLIGKTQLLNFEGVYSLQDARVYTLADIQAGLVPNSINRQEGDEAENTLNGTVQRDRLYGLGGNDTLLGLAEDDLLDGGAGNDALDGGDGNDQLIGGTGLDIMNGGAGDDRYYVDDAGDEVNEMADAGHDAVYSSIDYALGDNVEDLTLQGAALSAMGNALGNLIMGTASANVLSGGDGDDTLFGMAGNDSIAGDGGDDRLYGGDGNDSLRGGLGDDHIDGGADLGGTGDTVLFDGLRSDYTIAQLGDGSVQVTAINGGLEGSDRISNVERLAFMGEPEATRFVVLRKPELAGSLAALTILEDTTFSVDLPVSQFSDPAGGILAFRVRQSDGSPLPEWLNFNGSTFSGTPPANYSGTIALDVKVIGGEGVTSAAMTFVVQNVNDAPYQSAPIPDLTIPSGGTSGMGVIGYFTDPDNNSLTPSVTLANGDPVPSWLFVNSGKGLTITPPAGTSGHYIVRVTVSDGLATANGTFRLTYGGGGNSAPVLNLPLSDATVDGGSAISIPIPAGTFKDANADPLNFTASLADGSALPAWLSFVNGQLAGTAPTGASNTYSIKITASDGLDSAFDLFDLTVNSSNSAPILVAPISDVTAVEDTPVNFVIPANTFSDVDGDSLSLTAVLENGSALPAWLSFDGERFTGTPPANFNGVLTIRVTASDGLSTATDVFDLVIEQVNDAPVVQTPIADLFGDEDAGISFSIPASAFIDVDGDILAISAELIDGGPLPSWLAFDGRRFSGTPPTDFNGLLDIRVRGSDGSASATDTFRLTINPMNDPPVQIAPLAMQVSQEDTYIDVALDTSAFADVDGDSLSFTARMQDGSALPAWLHFDGSRFTGNPPQDFNGMLVFAVTASDGQGQITADFSLAISPANDVPVQLSALPPISALEDQPLSVTLPDGIFADADGDVLTYSARLADGAPLPGWLQFDGLTFSGIPPQNFNGSIDLIVSASDGTAQTDAPLRLTITAVNDAPVLSAALIDQSALLGDPINFAIPSGTFSDVDSDGLSLTATLADGSPLPSWLSFDGQRLVGTAPSTGTFDVRITASDGSASISDIVTLAVLPRNRAPDAQDDGLFVTDQSQQLVIAAADLLANDSDPDGDTLQIVSVQGAAHGTVSIAANGDIIYTPNGTYVGTDSFSYTLSDGTTTDVAQVSVLVESPFANWTQGTAGNDKLFGNMAMANQIFGAAGNDMIKGGQQDDMLAGGDGNDHLIGLGGNDHFWGGAGSDLINGNSGQDYAHYAGLRSSYSIVTVNGTVTVVDNAPTQDGNDGTDSISSIEQLVFKNGETASVISPIVLDLDGRGVQTLSASASKARYDFNGDGRRDDTSWIGATEGFLFLDRDGNGTLSGANELSFIDDLPGARSDLDGLRAFDSDGNGKLAAGDGMFARFRVWRDGDGDGIVDSGEVMTLAQAGVKAINLTGSAVNAASAFGEVAVVNQGSYVRTDGSTMQFVDAALTYFTKQPRRPNAGRIWGRGEFDFEQGPAADAPSALDGAIAALSASNSSDPIAAIAGMSDAEAFSRFAAPANGAAPASASEKNIGQIQVEAMAIEPTFEQQSLPDLQSAGPLTVPNDSANLLALMRQDMAGFGSNGALDRIEWISQRDCNVNALSMV